MLNRKLDNTGKRFITAFAYAVLCAVFIYCNLSKEYYDKNIEVSRSRVIGIDRQKKIEIWCVDGREYLTNYSGGIIKHEIDGVHKFCNK